MPTGPNILILGGGAAGFFAAVTCAETNPQARVTILEKSRALLLDLLHAKGLCDNIVGFVTLNEVVTL